LLPAACCLLPAACTACYLLLTDSSLISLTSGASAVVQAVGGSELNRDRRAQQQRQSAETIQPFGERCGLQRSAMGPRQL